MLFNISLSKKGRNRPMRSYILRKRGYDSMRLSLMNNHDLFMKNSMANIIVVSVSQDGSQDMGGTFQYYGAMSYDRKGKRFLWSDINDVDGEIRIVNRKTGTLSSQ